MFQVHALENAILQRRKRELDLKSWINPFCLFGIEKNTKVCQVIVKY